MDEKDNGTKEASDLRERSWRLRCSLRLKARLQNWHLYFFSGALVLRTVAGDAFDAISAGRRYSVGVGVVGAVSGRETACIPRNVHARMVVVEASNEGGRGGGWQ